MSDQKCKMLWLMPLTMAADTLRMRRPRRDTFASCQYSVDEIIRNAWLDCFSWTMFAVSRWV